MERDTKTGLLSLVVILLVALLVAYSFSIQPPKSDTPNMMYLKFDLSDIPENATIENATLVIWKYMDTDNHSSPWWKQEGCEKVDCNYCCDGMCTLMLCGEELSDNVRKQEK